MAAALNINLELRLPHRAWIGLVALFIFLASAGSLGSMEQVQMTVYYPAPSGAYQQMLVNGNAYLAMPNPGGSAALVEAGGVQPVADASIVLMVNNASRGNVGIGTLAPAASGLEIGAGVPGGQAQLQLDNADGQSAQIDRWTNRLEVYATDAITLQTGIGGSTNYNGDFGGYGAWVNPANPVPFDPVGGNPPLSTSWTYGTLHVPSNTSLSFQGPVSATAMTLQSQQNRSNVPSNCLWTQQETFAFFDAPAVAFCPWGYHVVSGGGTCLGAALTVNEPSSIITWLDSWTAWCTQPSVWLAWDFADISISQAFCCQNTY